jgi:RNA polymerase sigma factor (sigma-70 family)
VTDHNDTGVLVQSAAGGDRAAWAALVKRFSGLVWSVARAYRLSTADAEEVYQTAWLRLAEHLSRLKEPARVGGWLATTTRHESLRVLRQAGRVTITDDPHLLDTGTTDRSPEQVMLAAEAVASKASRNRRLWSAFQRLPERCRELLSMLVVADPPVSYADVASALGIPVGSIGPTRARCLGKLRELLVEAG